MNKGICFAGSMIVDIHYPIDGYPGLGELVHIKDGIHRATGGAVCNTAIDIAKLDSTISVSTAGRNGDDAEGKLVIETLNSYGIDTQNVINEGISAFTLVLNDIHSKQRTFFTYPGANGRFDVDDIHFDQLNCDILHLGYILLLDTLDKEDPEYGTRMARLLAKAQENGIRTSIDVVSEASDRFKRIVGPAMKHTDYCIINEFEASQTTGIKLRDENDKLIIENIRPALQKMKEMGVSTWAVIHCPEGGYGLDENDNFVECKSLSLPAGYIKGSTGAGDAFCAGVLCGAEKGKTLVDSIRLGVATAAASLSESNATDGVRSEAEVMQLYERFS